MKHLRNIVYASLAVLLVVMIPIGRKLFDNYYRQQNLMIEYKFNKVERTISELKDQLKIIEYRYNQVRIELKSANEQLKLQQVIINDLIFRDKNNIKF